MAANATSRTSFANFCTSSSTRMSYTSAGGRGHPTTFSPAFLLLSSSIFIFFGHIARLFFNVLIPCLLCALDLFEGRLHTSRHAYPQSERAEHCSWRFGVFHDCLWLPIRQDQAVMVSRGSTYASIPPFLPYFGRELIRFWQSPPLSSASL